MNVNDRECLRSRLIRAAGVAESAMLEARSAAELPAGVTLQLAQVVGLLQFAHDRLMLMASEVETEMRGDGAQLEQ